MNILLIGLGSIGHRHLCNLLELGYSDISVVSRGGCLPEQYASLQCFSSLAEALAAGKYDAAIICTPTAFHIEALFALLTVRVEKIYIEKPISHNLDKVNEIVELATAYPNKIVVGYDLHFDPGMMKVKELLQHDAIGKVVSANAQVGQYLPDWRPQQDYTKGMSAKHDTGGGVMLDLVHEFDYLYYLLGPASNLCSQYAHTGALKIETEDVCEVLIRFTNGAIGTIHLDYLQQKLVRNCLLTGHTGSIVWDLAANCVSHINSHKQETVFEYKEYNRNDRLVAIMQAFLNDEKDDRLTSLADGIESLRWVMAAKHSAKHNAFVNPQTFNPELLSK